MKQLIKICALTAVLAAAVSLSGCLGGTRDKGGERRFGIGAYSYYTAPTDADGDVNGECSAVTTVAAVLFDKDGKVLKCKLDCASNALEYTSDGKYVNADEFKTKRELGDSYGMTMGGAVSEWYHQADVFESIVKGKTVSQIKGLEADGGKGNEDVINAGCTIKVTEFIYAIEEADKSAKTTSASADDELRLAVLTEQGASYDATDEDDGEVSCESVLFGVLIDSKGKLTACSLDAVSAKVPFDEHGEEELEDDAKLKSKRELGDSYGMKAAGAEKEWYEQADAFESKCIGRTADDIASLEESDGYGSEELQSAGCTVKVSPLVRAALKAVR